MSVCKKLGDIFMVLFDMDGLLLDTESLYTKAVQEILDDYGLTYTMEVKAQCMGRKALESAAHLLKVYGIEDKIKPEEFERRKYAILEDLFPECKLMPGAEKLMRHLKNHKVPMALATSSLTSKFKQKMTNHGPLFEEMFPVVITGDQVENSKPNPEIFNKAAAGLQEKLDLDKISPENILVFEDAPSGVEAGLAANMKVVFVSDILDEYNGKGQPDEFLKSLEEFVPEKWGLPPY